MKRTSSIIAAGRILSLIITGGTALTALGQGELASGTISGAGSGTNYNYSLTFSDAAAATSSIGSVWYAWVPGAFYLPGMPTSVSAPPGWTANVSGYYGLYSVRYVAKSPADYIAAGQSLSGFGYQAAFSPAQLAATPYSGDSVAYSAGLYSDSGNDFTVQAVPEPSTPGLLAAGVLSLALARRWKLRSRAG